MRTGLSYVALCAALALAVAGCATAEGPYAGGGALAYGEAYAPYGFYGGYWGPGFYDGFGGPGFFARHHFHHDEDRFHHGGDGFRRGEEGFHHGEEGFREQHPSVHPFGGFAHDVPAFTHGVEGRAGADFAHGSVGGAHEGSGPHGPRDVTHG